MGNMRPSKSTKATDHIQEQLDMVKGLEKKGYAYVIKDDGVYFDTSKFADYGKMAGLKLDQQQEGARVEKVEGKRNSADFALWKFEREGENRAMSWESPWSKRSFPGWHIECSAMSMKYLGAQFDIHAGGVDHIPVHHTNEIAQAEAYSDKKPFVKYWVHFNFLKIEGRKMSKSLGNFYTIDDIINKGYLPRALRLLFLTAHYQSELNFTWKNLEGAQTSYLKLLKKIMVMQKEVEWLNLKNKQGVLDDNKESREIVELKIKFFGYLADNLNTPQAVVTMWEVVSSKLSSEDKLELLYSFDEVLQLNLKNAQGILNSLENKSKKDVVNLETLSKEVKQLLVKRQRARDEKNWKEADKLRDTLLKQGYTVLDSSKGQEVKRV